MDVVSLGRLTQEVGLPIGIFGLCCWMVFYIVKRMAGSIDKLVKLMDLFTSRVRDEHENHSKEHEMIMKQHEGITETLGRINGYKSS